MGFYKTLRRALTNTGFFDQAKKYDEDNELMLVRPGRNRFQAAQQQQAQKAPAHMGMCLLCTSCKAQPMLLST
jgi:hypothetical protein